MKFRDDENTAFLQAKIPFLSFGIFLFFVVVFVRLFFLQILNGDQYTTLATKTFVRTEEIVARRGAIIDRWGGQLADTRPYFAIAMTPQYLEDQDKVIESLTRLLPLKREDILEQLNQSKLEPTFMPVVIAEDVSYDFVAKLREHLADTYPEGSDYFLNGVSLVVTPIRRYLYPELFSHALGYLREVDKAQLEKFAMSHPDVYSRGDLTGASGVEKTYDIELKGQDGQIGRVVDARGREIPAIEDVRILQEGSTTVPQPGYALRTTLDFEAQQAVQTAFAGRKGALVALDPNDGEVIALYSSPGFDANRIMKNREPAYWQKVNLDPDKYLFNRAIQAMYPPASTYKPMAAIAGVDSGAIDPLTTKATCSGGMSYGNRYFKCWNLRGHGTVNILHGISLSCDVFFYQLGLKVGVDGLAKYAGLMGYGSPTGIDIPFEQAGLVPTKAWKQKRFKQDWIESETLSVSIGQSYNLVTPLQNAKMVAMVANGGYAVVPHIGKELLKQNGEIYQKIEYPKTPTELVGSQGLDWARRGMIEVVQGVGTATRLRASPHKIAGKTGTAQVVGHDSGVARTHLNENHGLFIGFAPYDDPKIAVSVIVENGGSGSGAAAPIAQKVIDVYLSRVDKELRK